MWCGQACFLCHQMLRATSVIAVERFLKCKYNSVFFAAAAMAAMYPMALISFVAVANAMYYNVKPMHTTVLCGIIWHDLRLSSYTFLCIWNSFPNHIQQWRRQSCIGAPIYATACKRTVKWRINSDIWYLRNNDLSTTSSTTINNNSIDLY